MSDHEHEPEVAAAQGEEQKKMIELFAQLGLNP
jgi:hypothetical protein